MTTTTTTTRAAIYCRVSSEEQASEGTSLATQEERCRAYCVAQGWDVQDVYIDAGVSGALASRPALDAMLGAIHAGQVDAMLVAKLDRLGRAVQYLGPLIADLDARDVALVSVAESFDSKSPGGRLMRTILAGFAEHERDVIAERTTAGRRARVTSGGWGGGNVAPYGYRVVGERGEAHLEVDEREATMIRRAVELLLDKGFTTGQVARALNDEGFTPRQAPRWSATNLRNVLLRKRFDGVWTYAKGSKQGAIEVAIPAILGPERAEALRLYLRNTTTAKSPRERPYPLTGRLFGTCGHHFHGIGRADRTVIRYRCNYGRDVPHQEVRCYEATVRAEEVEGAVWEAVLGLLSDPDRLMAQAAEHLGLLVGAAEVERDARVRAEAEVERRQAALVDATTTCIQSGLGPVEVKAVVGRLQQQLAEARQHASMVATMQATTGQEVQRVSQVQALAQVAQHRLANADLGLQTRILSLLGVRVQIVDHGEPGHRGRRGGPVQVRITGNVAHGLLLAGAESDWHPAIVASAPA